MNIQELFTTPEHGVILKKLGIRQDTHAHWRNIGQLVGLPTDNWTFGFGTLEQNDSLPENCVPAFMIRELYTLFSYPASRYPHRNDIETPGSLAIDNAVIFIIKEIEFGNIDVPSANKRLGDPTIYPLIVQFPEL